MTTPMQTLIKKLMGAYLLAVVIVGIYFLINTLFSEEKTVQLKSFHTDKDPRPEDITLKEETTQFKRDEPEGKRAFILLPQK